MRELNVKEIEQVNGGVVANILGAVAGGVGGFFGSIIGGGQSATGTTILAGTLGGAAAGFLNPISGVGNALAAVGGGVVAGGVTNGLGDM